MISLIPAEWRTMLVVAAIAVLCGLSAAGAAVVATWKADADHAAEILELGNRIDQLTDEKHRLELAIEEQNKGVAVAEAQTQAAKDMQAQAQQHADDLAAFSKSRMDKLDKSLAELQGCAGVLKRYWELRQ